MLVKNSILLGYITLYRLLFCQSVKKILIRVKPISPVELFRKRGAVDVLLTLRKFSEPVLERTFLREFQGRTYYQNYDRGRGVLMELNLIAYGAAPGKNKTIVLTPRGRQVADLLAQIEHVLEEGQ